MDYQQTLGGSFTLEGIALHTGCRTQAIFHPAEANFGVRFCRKDLPGAPMIRASALYVTDTQRGTTITENGGSVHTVEHLLASLHAMKIDNALIEMFGPEPPILDGSSKLFIDKILEVGIVVQDAEARYIDVKEPMVLEFKGTKTAVFPDDQFRMCCSVKYDCNPMDCQYKELIVTPESFREELQEARTFCLQKEIDFLMKNNLIIGGSLDNAVVIQENAILSRDGLRYPDEFVRHKMLDFVGDIFLLGARFRGFAMLIKPGHSSNVALAKAILEQHGIC